MINFTFTNGTNSITLKYVRSVEWQSELADDLLVDTATRRGHRTRTVTVNGFINNGVFTSNVAAQQSLETDLVNIGTGTIQYTGATNIGDVRFLRLEFSEFRGNPILEFKIFFTTDENNVQAHTPIVIGGLTLSPANGYEYASVKDTITSQGPDERMSNLRARAFTIEGSFVDSTLNGINEKQQALIAEVENKTTLVITMSTGSGAFVGSYTVRPRRLEFSAPHLKGDKTARSFTFESVTHDDYTKEPYTLGEVAQSFGGITIDVVEGVDHNREYDKAGAAIATIEEELSITGKKYFTSWTAYATFRDIFRPIPAGVYLIGSASGNTLDLVDVSVGKFERDGNFGDTNKRYSTSVTLSFKWKKEISQVNYEVFQAHLGVTFYKINNVSFSSQVDSFGSVTSRSININGDVLSLATLNQLKATVGTTVNYDATYTNLVVTSVSVNNTETHNISGAQTAVYKVSVTASQLETSSQANQFLRGLFRMSRAGATGTSYSTDTIQFENVTSLSKSLSNRWDATNLKFKVTSISLSISGEVFDPDNGSGKPINPNKIIDLFNKIDALLANGLSIQGAANSTPSGEVLPSNSDVKYVLNNISVGNWQPGVAPENLQGGNGSKGARYWKQTVSLSVTAVFDLSGLGGSQNQPDSIESKSIEITVEAPKYTQLQVVGFGTVFKRIGTTPEVATVVYQKQFKDARVYVRDDYGTNDVTPTGWRGVGKNVITKDVRENRGLVNRRVVEYSATEKLGS